MKHSLLGIIKLAILAGQACLISFDANPKGRYAREKQFLFVALAAGMVLAWCNLGNFGGNGLRLVHHWEQFHFYLGAKYQKEVGWFDLYRAAVLADAETTRVVRVTALRNNETFDLEPVSVAFAQRDRIVGRFGPERWEEFKRDWVALVAQPVDWNRILQDHGNSNSPAWSVLAHPIASVVPLTPDGQAFIGWLDMMLMGVMWWFIWKTFDWKVTSIALLAWAMPPLVFNYLAGSFLRWDWLFCLGMAVVMMKREKWLSAGLFFGFAVATKLFPVVFGLALGIRAAVTCWRDKKIHARYRKFALGTAASGIAAVVLAAFMFDGFWVWSEYKRRIDAAVYERFYNIQYSLRPVYLQWRVSVGCAISCGAEPTFDECAAPACRGCCDARGHRSPDELLATGLFPREMKQARTDVDLADYPLGFRLLQLLMTLAIVVLIIRSDDIGAFTLGPLLVFTWLIVNMYYWNMFGLLALGLARREEQLPARGALIGLFAIFFVYYLFELTDGYLVALQLCVWVLAFAYFELRVIRADFRDLVSMLYGRKRA